MDNPFQKLPISFKYVLMTALIFSLLILLEDYSGYLINGYEYEYSWFTVGSQALSTYLVWALLSPIVSGQASSIQSKKGIGISQIIIAIAKSLLIGLIHRFVYQRLSDLIYYTQEGFLASPFSEKNIQLLGTGWITSIIQYWIIFLIFFSILYYKAFLQKQKELSRAQLQALKMQLHPHFLFNTLHSISSLIDIDKKAAQKMVSQLGGLMRNTLEQEEKEEATLAEELNYVKAYLSIEQVRFQDRLEIVYNVQREAELARLPYLILQPIIENAIKHGIQDLQEYGKIEIFGMLENDRLNVQVINNGTKKSGDKIGKGIGLKNTRNRLNQFFEGDYRMEADPNDNQGYEVNINVPFLKQEET